MYISTYMQNKNVHRIFMGFKINLMSSWGWGSKFQNQHKVGNNFLTFLFLVLKVHTYRM